MTDSSNPKHLMGAKKVPTLSVLPSAGLIYEALAMDYGAYEAPRADGTKGYGPFNWRETEVVAMIYVDALFRHVMDWVDGNELAPDSKRPHLGHAKACLGILIDALESGNLIDNRPPPGNAAELLEKWNNIKKVEAEHAKAESDRRKAWQSPESPL